MAARKSTRSRTRKPASRARTRKYSRHASTKVGKAMHEMKRGTLKSGRSGKTVRSRKQAIAIGLSQARKEGARVPSRGRRRRTRTSAR